MPRNESGTELSTNYDPDLGLLPLGKSSKGSSQQALGIVLDSKLLEPRTARLPTRPGAGPYFWGLGVAFFEAGYEIKITRVVRDSKSKLGPNTSGFFTTAFFGSNV